MKFGAIDTMDKGLVPLKVTGMYNMPGRIAPYLYDWGDETEPIYNTGFLGRTGSVKFLFDQRPQTVTKTFDVITRESLSADPFTLELTEATGAIGQHTVVVNNVSNHKPYKNNETCLYGFYEQIPAFPGSLPGSQSGGSESLGGYAFSQFDIVVSKHSNISGLGSAKTSPINVYKNSRGKTTYRSFHPFTLECYLIASNATDALTKLHNFQKLLTTEGVLSLTYKGLTFDTFFSQGFQVTKRRKNIFKFNLPLNRIT